ncbi:FtsX-like permease family protein [Mumia sp. DW29H23]|uniref:ABC transporter permease n=1 Tax=Mumia sp. DW29H23 TaxID=3421241 RepID=UPI003D6831F6
MSGAVARWRLALRMARRDVRRSKGRSALVAVMVGTPVMLAVLLSTVYAGSEISALENMPAELGGAAARVSWQGGGAVQQSPDGMDGGTFLDGSDTEPLPEPDARAVGALLPGADVLEVRSSWRRLALDKPQEVLEVDTREPAAAALLDLSDGHVPEASGEVVVTPRLRERLDVEVGDTVTLGGRDVSVVGVGTFGSVGPYPDALGVVALPGTLPGVADPETTTDFLIVRDAPVTWDDVQRLNAAGFWATSRHVLENPPPASEQYDLDEWDGGDGTERAVLVIVVTAIVLQVVLLAGPAFAVGVRRQRRDLALVAAAGGSPADVRRTVLAQAAVLGVGSSLVGAALGLGVAPLVMAGITRWADEPFGPYDVMWPAVAAAVVLGVVASLLAALVPARQVAGQDVTAALVARRTAPGQRHGWPLVGAALVVVGLGVCFTAGVQPGGEVAVAGATVAIVLGAVFLTPLVIGAVGRVGTRLPLALRLAVRDTARQRSRSTPAVAAVMATVAGLTALAIASASDFEQSRQAYTFTYPLGTTVLSQPGGDVDAAEVAGTAAGVPFTPLGSGGQSGDSDGAGWIDVSLDTEAWDGWSIAQVAVATPEELAAWGVELTPQQSERLRSGDALVANPAALDGQGRVGIAVAEETRDGASSEPRTVSFDAVAADLTMGAVPQGPEPRVGQAVISPQSAQAHAIPYQRSQAIAGGTLSTQQLRDVRAALKELPGDQGIWTERGFQETFTVQLLLLIGAGGLAVLIGTLTATGLALADARPDFATLAAVGAGPRTRRAVAAAQAVVLGILGAALGVVVGFAPGLAATWPLTSDRWGALDGTGDGPIIDIPWGVLATIVLVVPLIAAGASALVTRGRVPLTRRLAQ